MTTPPPPAKRARAGRSPAERPAQILDAAARVFLRDGLEATVEAIAAEAGLGKGTVYEYYGSKAQILTALRKRYTDQILAAGMEASEPLDTRAIDRVRRFITGMFTFGVATGELVTLLFHEAGIEEDDELEPIKAGLLTMVRDGVNAGELAVDDPEFSVEFLLHGLHGTMENSLAQGDDPEQVIKRVDGILVAILNPTNS